MPRSFVELSLEERRRLAQLLGHKVRVSRIAEVLDPHRSTIYREIRRNWWHDVEVPAADGVVAQPRQQRYEQAGVLDERAETHAQGSACQAL